MDTKVFTQGKSKKTARTKTANKEAAAKTNGFAVSATASIEEIQTLREFLERELADLCESERRIGLYSGHYEFRLWVDYSTNIGAKIMLPTSTRDAHVIFYAQTIRKLIRESASLELQDFLQKNSA
jgi:hypothetical protein